MTEPTAGIDKIKKDPSLREANKLNELVKNQYAKLKTVPVKSIEKFSALVVNVPIGDLSYKDAKRVVYVLAGNITKMQSSFNRVVTDFDASIKLVQDRIKEIKEESTPVLSGLEELENISKGIDDIIKLAEKKE